MLQKIKMPKDRSKFIARVSRIKETKLIKAIPQRNGGIFAKNGYTLLLNDRKAVYHMHIEQDISSGY